MKIYPVIHHLDRPTTLAQAQLAIDAGADGVFLISHNGEDSVLPLMAQDVRRIAAEQQKEFDVGINLLSTPPSEAMFIALCECLDMIWFDRAGVSGAGATSLALDLSRCLREENEACRVDGVKTFSVFASVAFKYQPEEPNPMDAARNARALDFIPTTSGPATGSPPTLEKLVLMAGGKKIAVASGLNIHNIAEFAPYLSHALVASSVSVDEHHFDFQFLSVFIARARAAAEL